MTCLCFVGACVDGSHGCYPNHQGLLRFQEMIRGESLCDSCNACFHLTKCNTLLPTRALMWLRKTASLCVYHTVCKFGCAFLSKFSLKSSMQNRVWKTWFWCCAMFIVAGIGHAHCIPYQLRQCWARCPSQQCTHTTTTTYLQPLCRVSSCLCIFSQGHSGVCWSP